MHILIVYDTISDKISRCRVKNWICGQVFASEKNKFSVFYICIMELISAWVCKLSFKIRKLNVIFSTWMLCLANIKRPLENKKRLESQTKVKCQEWVKFHIDQSIRILKILDGSEQDDYGDCE